MLPTTATNTSGKKQTWIGTILFGVAILIFLCGPLFIVFFITSSDDTSGQASSSDPIRANSFQEPVARQKLPVERNSVEPSSSITSSVSSESSASSAKKTTLGITAHVKDDGVPIEDFIPEGEDLSFLDFNFVGNEPAAVEPVVRRPNIRIPHIPSIHIPEIDI